MNLIKGGKLQGDWFFWGKRIWKTVGLTPRIYQSRLTLEYIDTVRR